MRYNPSVSRLLVRMSLGATAASPATGCTLRELEEPFREWRNA
jgi:hypothetical protein